MFEVSLDELVKGDLEEMNKQIEAEDVRVMKRDSIIYAVLLIGSILLFVPMYVFFGLTGFLIWICIYAIVFMYALKLEKQKKNNIIFKLIVKSKLF